MTGTTSPARVPSDTPSEGHHRPSAGELLKRFLTLREGSIIVVTILATLYFTLSTQHFFTHANFINVVLFVSPS